MSTRPKALEDFLESQGYNHIIGHHFFNRLNGTNIPVFAFDQLAQTPYPIARVVKISGADAPKYACPGLSNEGAVQWLYLSDTHGISQGTVDTVYRIETAGGKSPVTCKGQGPNFTVPYAAECKYMSHVPQRREQSTNNMLRLGFQFCIQSLV